MIDGIIIKGIGGFYYVNTEDDNIIESRARGLFREEDLTPLIGDRVRIRINQEDGSGYIEEIYPRKSQLIRPPVANISQVIIVNSILDPKINPWLLDRFIIMAEHEGLDIVICFNKFDLDEEATNEYRNIYEKAGYKTLATSTETGLGIEDLRSTLENNITVFAGPSGVGKSSLLNAINKDFKLETGGVSEKTKRGKHTTRHVELLELNTRSYVLDSPGFGSLNIDFIQEEVQLRDYFREIDKYGSSCRFLSCLHRNEPACEVKKQVELGEINKNRYKNYLDFLEELRNIRRY